MSVELEDFAFATQTALSDALLHNGPIPPNNISVKTYADKIARINIMQIEYHLLGERLDHIECPADWWQAVKERWFPQWALRRWPVRMKRWEARAYYPKVSLSKEDHVIRFEREVG